MATIAEVYADMKVMKALEAMLPAISEIEVGSWLGIKAFCETANAWLRPLGWQIEYDIDKHLEARGDPLRFLRILPVKDNEKV